MTKYAFANMPAHGHVYPTLAVVQELVARGEQVSYYITEDFRASIEAAGATVCIYQSKMGSLHTNQLTTGDQNNFLKMPSFLVDETRDILPQVIESLRAEQPDYIVYDGFCMWAKIAARALHIPAIRLFPSYAASQHFSMGNNMGAIMSAMGAINEKMLELCRAYNVEPFDMRDMFQGSEALNIVFLPKEFQPASETFDERFVFVGPAIQSRPAQNAFPFEKLSELPLVYISLGTVFNHQVEFYKQCLTALKDEPWQVVLAHGKLVDPALLGPLPQNFLLAAHVPQLEILQRASLFVTHCGMNSTMESLYYGVPMVAIPQMPAQIMPEQMMTAQRVQELGLGIKLDKDSVTSDGLRAAVEQVMAEQTYCVHVQAMQKHVQQAGGYKRAADAIMGFAASAQIVA